MTTAAPLIYAALAAILADMDHIGKNSRNQSQGFNFRGIDAVYNTLNPLLAKHKVFTVPVVLSDRTEERQTKNGGNLIYRVLTIRYDFFATDGSCVSATVIGEGMDNGDKAANKAMSVAHKYALFQVFAIPTEEVARDDPDRESHEVVAKTPQATPAKTQHTAPAPDFSQAPAANQPTNTDGFAPLPRAANSPSEALQKATKAAGFPKLTV